MCCASSTSARLGRGFRAAGGARAQRFAVRRVDAPGNCYIPLDTTWDEFYATRSRRLKKANNLAAIACSALARFASTGMRRACPAPQRSTYRRGGDRHFRGQLEGWKRAIRWTYPGPQAFIRRLSDLRPNASGFRSGCFRSTAGRSRWRFSSLPTVTFSAALGFRLRTRRSFTRVVSQPIPARATVRPRACTATTWAPGTTRTSIAGPNRSSRHEVSVYGRSLSGRALAAWESR